MKENISLLIIYFCTFTACDFLIPTEWIFSSISKLWSCLPSPAGDSLPRQQSIDFLKWTTLIRQLELLPRQDRHSTLHEADQAPMYSLLIMIFIISGVMLQFRFNYSNWRFNLSIRTILFKLNVKLNLRNLSVDGSSVSAHVLSELLCSRSAGPDWLWALHSLVTSTREIRAEQQPTPVDSVRQSANVGVGKT